MKLINAVVGSESTVNRSENEKQPFPTQSEPNLTAPHGASDAEYLTVYWLTDKEFVFLPCPMLFSPGRLRQNLEPRRFQLYFH